MTPRERVLTALRREVPDRVPWMEGIVENGIASAVCGRPINVTWSIAPDGLPTVDGEAFAREQIKVNEAFGKDNINWTVFAPIFARKMERAPGSPVIVGDGMIRSRDDFKKHFTLPPADNADFLRRTRSFIAHKADYCAVACIRLGIGATLLSMGIEGFSYAMVDDVELIRMVHGAYADWTRRAIPLLEDVGFDVIWAFDDLAFNSGPIFPPSFYEEEILPVEREVTRDISIPFITHSDGDMTALLDAWLTLDQDAIHPIQPDVMDINEVKERYGDRVALVGNIFMDDLVHKRPADIEEQVKERIDKIGAGGGYIISSSNSLTDDMKPENVKAMIDAIDNYGWYPE
jgi:hypothetical protein